MVLSSFQIMRAGLATGSVPATAAFDRWLNPLAATIQETQVLPAQPQTQHSESDRRAQGFIVDDEKTEESRMFAL
jgi:hypothetical protein